MRSAPGLNNKLLSSWVFIERYRRLLRLSLQPVRR